MSEFWEKSLKMKSKFVDKKIKHFEIKTSEKKTSEFWYLCPNFKKLEFWNSNANS